MPPIQTSFFETIRQLAQSHDAEGREEEKEEGGGGGRTRGERFSSEPAPVVGQGWQDLGVAKEETPQFGMEAIELRSDENHTCVVREGVKKDVKEEREYSWQVLPNNSFWGDTSGGIALFFEPPDDNGFGTYHVLEPPAVRGAVPGRGEFVVALSVRCYDAERECCTVAGARLLNFVTPDGGFEPLEPARPRLSAGATPAAAVRPPRARR